VKGKTNVRYIDFTSDQNGSRIFNFSLSAAEQTNALTSVEIPVEFFAGGDRIMLQDGVGISSAKLQQLMESGVIANIPRQLCLTASDVAEFRKKPEIKQKRRQASLGMPGMGSEGTEPAA
jgi:hypothetical protein